MNNIFTRIKYFLVLVLLSSIGIFDTYGQYCTPQYLFDCEGPDALNPGPTADYINNFSTSQGVTNITNNNSGCSANNYNYYSSQTVSAAQGCSFNVSMQCNSQFAQGFRIWIDWNQDGIFQDPAERVYSSPASGIVVYNGTVQVPSTALLGVTRMRVRSSFAAIPASPCNLPTGLEVGEAEDYNLEGIAATDATIDVSDVT
ncbi:MAG: GEVED domain-containing protein, partial [Bacteroidia bacterium]